MGRKQHVADLSDEERRTLKWFISTGEHRAKISRAHGSSMKIDEGLTDSKICEHLGCSISTPYNAHKNYCKRWLGSIIATNATGNSDSTSPLNR